MIDYENLGRVNAPWNEDLEAAFRRVLHSGWFVLGPEVEKFEKAFAAYCGARHCVGVANGLDALWLALEALELPPQSEVIIPSNTYIATILAVLKAGHKPILVEPDPRTCNLDPARVPAAITTKTRVIMPVHLYGKSCDMAPLVALCEKQRLHLIEDCAQSHGATYQGRMTGTFGIGAFSFYPTKNLGALGDAGALTCQDDALAEKLRTLRNYGSRKKYHNDLVGTNSRLDELQAALLSAKLPHLPRVIERKRQLAEIYFAKLPPEIELPARDPQCFDVFHIFNVRTERRDELRDYLLAHGVKTDIHYPVPPHQQVAMRGVFDGGSYPISERIHRTTLSLPISSFHQDHEIETVARLITEFFHPPRKKD